MIRANDTITIYQQGHDGYGDDLVSVASATLTGTFLQNTGITRQQYRTEITSDAVFYPNDVLDSFLVDNNYRLEGFYILAPLFDVTDDDAWYKVDAVAVNRHHLINTIIDNVEIGLSKCAKPYGVS